MSHHDHIENDPTFKHLNVNKGVSQVETVNQAAAQRFLNKKRKLPTAKQFFQGIRNGP